MVYINISTLVKSPLVCREFLPLKVETISKKVQLLIASEPFLFLLSYYQLFTSLS